MEPPRRAQTHPRGVSVAPPRLAAFVFDLLQRAGPERRPAPPLRDAARARPRRPIPGRAAAARLRRGRRERRVDAGRGSRLRVGFAAVIGCCLGGGGGNATVPFSLSLPPPFPEAVGFYFRLLAPSLGKSTCSLRPPGVSGWVPFHDSLGEGRRWADERRGACGLRAWTPGSRPSRLRLGAAPPGPSRAPHAPGTRAGRKDGPRRGGSCAPLTSPCELAAERARRKSGRSGARGKATRCRAPATPPSSLAAGDRPRRSGQRVESMGRTSERNPRLPGAAAARRTGKARSPWAPRPVALRGPLRGRRAPSFAPRPSAWRSWLLLGASLLGFNFIFSYFLSNDDGLFACFSSTMNDSRVHGLPRSRVVFTVVLALLILNSFIVITCGRSRRRS